MKYIISVLLILLVSIIFSLIETLLSVGTDFKEFSKMFGKKKIIFWIIVNAVIFGIADYFEIVLGWKVSFRKVLALLLFFLFAVYCYKQCKDAEEKKIVMIILAVSFVIMIVIGEFLCVVDQW